MRQIISYVLLISFLAIQSGVSQVANVNLGQVESGGNQRHYDFHFVDTDVSAVMQALAVTAGVDFVLAPEVRGTKVNLKVTQKSWQEALDILCKNYELTWIIEDKYISIQRTASYQAKMVKLAEKEEQKEQVAPLIRKNFQIKNAKASDLISVLQGMKSSRGTITEISRNNAIIVMDTEQRLERMEKTLSELDVETLQIVITGKLVVVDSRMARELGVDWSAKLGQGNLTAADGGAGTDASINDSRNQVVVQSYPQGTTPSVSNASQTITMSLLDGNLGVGLYNILGEGNAEILASPQISTLDHEQAEIFMGDKISIRVIDNAGESSTQLVESGIKLTVTPHVTGDHRIMMELKTENNSYSYDDKGLPIISTQEATTKVVVADGETVVIGGLTKNEEQESETGVPFLKDIPVLGYLFKYYKKEVTKKDLMIFVTPRIQRNQFMEIDDVKALHQDKAPVATQVVEEAPAVENEPAAPSVPEVEAEPVEQQPAMAPQPADDPAVPPPPSVPSESDDTWD